MPRLGGAFFSEAPYSCSELGAQSFGPSVVTVVLGTSLEPKLVKVEWVERGGEAHCSLCIPVKTLPFSFGLRESFGFMEGFRTAHKEKQLFLK